MRSKPVPPPSLSALRSRRICTRRCATDSTSWPQMRRAAGPARIPAPDAAGSAAADGIRRAEMPGFLARDAMSGQVHRDIGVAQQVVGRTRPGARITARSRATNSLRLNGFTTVVGPVEPRECGRSSPRAAHDDRQRPGRRRSPDLSADFEAGDQRQSNRAARRRAGARRAQASSPSAAASTAKPSRSRLYRSIVTSGASSSTINTRGFIVLSPGLTRRPRCSNCRPSVAPG